MEAQHVCDSSVDHKNLSLFGLSKLTGLSKSYLNEIEKGKKYPKTDKIVTLSEALEVPYDHLVSLKLDIKDFNFFIFVVFLFNIF